MAVNADQVCRLCLAKEDHEGGVVLNSIQEYLPFLDSFAGLSQDSAMPQQICSNCEFQIESSQLLRKRAQYTESLWIKNTMFQPSTGIDLLMSCHMCNQSMDCYGLVNHIETVHGEDHFIDCNLCASIRGEKLNIGNTQQVVKDEPFFFDENWGDNLMADDACDVPQETDSTQNPLELRVKFNSEKYILPFKEYQTYYIDTIRQPNDPNTSYQCRTCDFISDNRKTVITHIEKNHKLDLIKVVARSLCESEVDNLITKIALEHTDEFVHSCTICQTESNSLPEMRSHIQKCHRHLEVGITTDNPDNIPTLEESDMETDHNPVGENDGETINISLRTDPHIWDHIRKDYITEGGRRFLRYICEICNQKYKAAGNIKNHIQKAHVNHLNLPSSGKEENIYNSKFNHSHRGSPKLWVHIGHEFVIKGERRIRSYFCKICKIKYRYSKDAKRHVMRQHVEPPKKKDLMYKSAKRLERNSLRPPDSRTQPNAPIWKYIEKIVTRNDLRTKTTYKCKICSKDSIRPDHMTKHVKNVHKNEISTSD